MRIKVQDDLVSYMKMIKNTDNHALKLEDYIINVHYINYT